MKLPGGDLETESHALETNVPTRGSTTLDSDDDDFRGSPIMQQLKRQRRSQPGPLDGVPCPVCGRVSDAAHVDACIESTCPSPPLSSCEVSEEDDDASSGLWRALGPELRKYVQALAQSGVKTLPDVANIPSPVERFLRDECGLGALGPRKRLAKRLVELGAGVQPEVKLDAPERRVTASLSGDRTEADDIVSPLRTSSDVWKNLFGAANQKTEHLETPFGASLKRQTREPAKRKRGTQFGSASGSTPEPRKTKRVYKHSFAKRVPDTSFVVDSFRAANSDECRRYFLSHFHSDHYETLRKSTLPEGALVLCSEVTASLVRTVLRVPQERIQVLPSDGCTPVDVEDTADPGNGVTVWLYNANHCPGAVLFLFYVWKTKRYTLHCGDCRYDPAVFLQHAHLVNVITRGKLDYLFLDTTYADPRYSFPPQETILENAVAAARREDARTRHRCLYFFGTYSIGKEKVFLAVAEALDLHIYADKRKRGLLAQLGFGERLSSRMVSEPGQARVHVVSMRHLSAEGLSFYTRRAKMNRAFVGSGLAVVFRPTGWSFRGGGESSTGAARQIGAASSTPVLVGVRRYVRGADQAISYELAYSEHSSFRELQEFVAWAHPARVIPTVNARSREDADRLRDLLGHSDRPLCSPCGEATALKQEATLCTRMTVRANSAEDTKPRREQTASKP